MQACIGSKAPCKTDNERGYGLRHDLGHSHDYEAVHEMLKTPACYIGLIGSRKKLAANRERLIADGFTDKEIDRITAPIGLEIGSETPAEIAVSIAAQLIAFRAQKENL